MIRLGTRKIEQLSLMYKDSEVDSVLALCSKEGWAPTTGTPQPVHRLLLRKAQGKSPITTKRGLDIVKGWHLVRLERPLKKGMR